MSSVHICPMTLMSIQIKIGLKTYQVYLGGFNGSNRRSPSPSAIPPTLLWLREPLQKRSEIFASCMYYHSVNSDGLELHYSVDSDELDVKLIVPSQMKNSRFVVQFCKHKLMLEFLPPRTNTHGLYRCFLLKYKLFKINRKITKDTIS